MRPIVPFLALLAVMAAVQAAAQQSVYRWVDKNGNVHFSDTPPLEDAKITEKRMGGGAGDETQLPYATQMAMKRNPVTLFSSKNCGDLCASGRDLLASRGIPYSERSPEASPADAEALKKLIGALEVPVLVVGETTLKGYNDAMWNAALDSAGYPKTLLPGQRAPTPPPPPTPAAPPAAPADEAPK